MARNGRKWTIGYKAEINLGNKTVQLDFDAITDEGGGPTSYITMETKYIRMLILSAQIDVLEELPYTHVYKSDSNLSNLIQKSAILMDDVIRVRNEKRVELNELSNTSQVSKLKKINQELMERIAELEK